MINLKNKGKRCSKKIQSFDERKKIFNENSLQMIQKQYSLKRKLYAHNFTACSVASLENPQEADNSR